MSKMKRQNTDNLLALVLPSSPSGNSQKFISFLLQAKVYLVEKCSKNPSFFKLMLTLSTSSSLLKRKDQDDTTISRSAPASRILNVAPRLNAFSCYLSMSYSNLIGSYCFGLYFEDSRLETILLIFYYLALAAQSISAHMGWAYLKVRISFSSQRGRMPPPDCLQLVHQSYPNLNWTNGFISLIIATLFDKSALIGIICSCASKFGYSPIYSSRVAIFVGSLFFTGSTNHASIKWLEQRDFSAKGLKNTREIIKSSLEFSALPFFFPPYFRVLSISAVFICGAVEVKFSLTSFFSLFIRPGKQL